MRVNRPILSVRVWVSAPAGNGSRVDAEAITPNLPTKITPTMIAWLKLSRKFPMGLRIPPLRIKILLESKPLKSSILVRRLAIVPVSYRRGPPSSSELDSELTDVR